MKLSDLTFADVRMLSLDGSTIRVILAEQVQMEFHYTNEEQMEADLAAWARRESPTKPSVFPFEFRRI